MPADLTYDLAATVNELATDWAVEAADLDLPYVALGHLAGRVIGLADSEDEVDLQPLFQEIEIRLATGDSATRDLLISGFLEALQNIDGSQSRRWERLLGPSTLIAWVGLNDLWAGRIDAQMFNGIIANSNHIGGR